MKCCQCQGIESLFDQEVARDDLAAYRKAGPDKTTRMLLEAIRAEGVENGSLLDIGGGIGAIQHELAAVTDHIINVDASSAYLRAAQEEAARRGYAERASYHHGDFVDLAGEIETADIVTLNRVICCYHDMESLVQLSAARAGQLYGLVYPRDSWWIRLGRPIVNGFFWLQRNPFRMFIHRTQKVDGLVRNLGFKRGFYRRTLIWQVVLYKK